MAKCTNRVIIMITMMIIIISIHAEIEVTLSQRNAAWGAVYKKVMSHLCSYNWHSRGLSPSKDVVTSSVSAIV